MKKHLLCLIAAGALCGLSLAAQAQTALASKPKTPPTKQASTSAGKGTVSKAPSAKGTYAIKDTTAFNRKFRRSSRPSSLPVPVPARPVQ